MSRHDILIVDDNASNIRLVAAELESDGYGIAFARSGAEALEQSRHKHFDLFLLDIMMPGMDGLEVCRALKERPEYKDTPVIFLTAREEKETLLEGFAVGGVDYVTKPFYGPEVRSRVNAQLRALEAQQLLEAAVDDLSKQLLISVQHENELQMQQEEMARFNRALLARASTDQLTGLANRYHMMAIAEYESERASRADSAYSFIIGDIDSFKHINDTHGHDCGDAILREIATRLQGAVRGQDLVARWGGEEFLVFLPDTSCEGARVLAEKLREAVCLTPFQYGNIEIDVTITLGVSSCEAADIETCIEQADRALYEGKRQGRNQSVAYEDGMSENPSE
ncbi:MAG: diguanylate cyclase [Spirochaetota bacterium]